MTCLFHKWFSLFSLLVFLGYIFFFRMVSHISYFALNRRDTNAIVMHGPQASRATRGCITFMSVSRVPFTYDSFTVLPRRRHPNDSPFLLRGFSTFLSREKPRRNPRRATNDRKNIAILIVHLTSAAFFSRRFFFFFFLSLFPQTE